MELRMRSAFVVTMATNVYGKHCCRRKLGYVCEKQGFAYTKVRNAVVAKKPEKIIRCSIKFSRV